MNAKQELFDFLKEKPNATIADIDELSAASQMETDDFINLSLEMLSSLAAGGRSQEDSDSYDAKQLSIGNKIEKEHTDDPVITNEIAKDHLEEDPKYYDHLKEMEEKYSSISKVFLNSKTAVVKVPAIQFTGEPVQIHKFAEYIKQYGNVVSYSTEIKNNLAHVTFKLFKENFDA